jgi:hypothetical protein
MKLLMLKSSVRFGEFEELAAFSSFLLVHAEGAIGEIGDEDDDGPNDSSSVGAISHALRPPRSCPLRAALTLALACAHVKPVSEHVARRMRRQTRVFMKRTLRLLEEVWQATCFPETFVGVC